MKIRYVHNIILFDISPVYAEQANIARKFPCPRKWERVSPSAQTPVTFIVQLLKITPAILSSAFLLWMPIIYKQYPFSFFFTCWKLS